MIETERLGKLRKLVQLANFLDDLPHRRFHMPKWVSGDATTESCGTAGCAAGWAATIFRKEGWHITPPVGYLERSNGCVFIYSHDRNIVSGTGAFSHFFGITPEESKYITVNIEWGTKDHPSYLHEYSLEKAIDITPAHAADRIRKVVRTIAPEILEESIPKIELALS